MIVTQRFLCYFIIMCGVHALLIIANQSVKCISCSSIGDGQTCVQSISRDRVCDSTSVMCYTNIVDGKVFRGCVGDRIFPNETSAQMCLDGVKCEVCSGDYCNQKILMDTCIQCNSADHGIGCKNKPNSQMQAVCTLRQNSITELPTGCYLAVIGDIYERGCVQNLHPRQKRLCGSKSKNCQMCSSPNCNQKVDFNINCFEYNGRVDENSQYQSENTTEIACNDYSKTCVVGIDGSGYLHRRCFQNHEHSLAVAFSHGYKRCFSNLCNDEIYPENRIMCYQCEGFGCDKLDIRTTKLKVCTHVQDLCYTYVDKDGTYYRGCITDSIKEKSNTKGMSLCEQDKSNCERCEVSGCNSYTEAKPSSSDVTRNYFTITFISLLLSTHLHSSIS